MEGKINKNGNLRIKRGRKYKDQYCPYESSSEVTLCGDWCPQFGEPDWYPEAKNWPDTANLNICQNRLLHFNQFKDERKQNEQ